MKHEKPPTAKSTSFLIIGYGNQLRGDDGIGPQVAEAVEQWNLPQIQVKSLHQLTPELADDLAKVDCAIFVDAWMTDSSDFSEIKVEKIEPVSPGNLISGHASNPRSLLAIALTLYGKSPQSWLISVPGINFEFSDRLSPSAETGVKAALEQIQLLISPEII